MMILSSHGGRKPTQRRTRVLARIAHFISRKCHALMGNYS